jgi:excisionase family DNA binding protein
MPLRNVVWLAEESGASKFSWRAWIRQRKIPHVRLGRRVLVDESDYRTFIAQNRIPATNANGKTGR